MTAATLSRNSNKFRLAGGAQPLILLPVHVNDRGPFDFILDTGAGTSLLSSELAKQLEAKVIGSKEGQSAGGKVSVSLAKVDSISVGETKLHDVDVGIVDLARSAWKVLAASQKLKCQFVWPVRRSRSF